MTYEQRLRALGRLIDQEEMHGLCILEVDGGVVVSGVGRSHARDGMPVVGPKSVEVADSVIAATAVLTGQNDASERG